MDHNYGPNDGAMNYKQPPYAYSNPVMTQPQPQMVNQVNVTLTAPVAASNLVQGRDWNSGLCGCCEDVNSCFCIWCFGPCYLCCCMSERMGEQCCTPVCLSYAHPGMFLPVLLYRTKLRAKFNIRGSAMDDCCCSFCCAELVACQIKRELDHIENDQGMTAFPRLQ